MAYAKVDFSESEFERVLDESVQKFEHINSLKCEQKACIMSIARKKDVFGILPTGFGKSLIFQLLPHVLKELWKVERSTVIVVTPLISIMTDQVSHLNNLGMKAIALGDFEDEKELRSKDFDVDVIYGSAERWLSETWSTELRDGKLGKQVVALVIDEVHSVSLW